MCKYVISYDKSGDVNPYMHYTGSSTGVFTNSYKFTITDNKLSSIVKDSSYYTYSKEFDFHVIACK